MNELVKLFPKPETDPKLRKVLSSLKDVSTFFTAADLGTNNQIEILRTWASFFIPYVHNTTPSYSYEADFRAFIESIPKPFRYNILLNAMENDNIQFSDPLQLAVIYSALPNAHQIRFLGNKDLIIPAILQHPDQAVDFIKNISSEHRTKFITYYASNILAPLRASESPDELYRNLDKILEIAPAYWKELIPVYRDPLLKHISIFLSIFLIDLPMMKILMMKIQ